MNQSTAVTITWILAAVALLAVAGAIYAMIDGQRQRELATAATHALREREREVEHFSAATMPLVAEAVRRADASVELPIRPGNDPFDRLLRMLAERFADYLRTVAIDVRDRTQRECDRESQQVIMRTHHEAQQSLSRAEHEAQQAISRVEREAAQAVATAEQKAQLAISQAEQQANQAVVEARQEAQLVASQAEQQARTANTRASSKVEHTAAEVREEAEQRVAAAERLAQERIAAAEQNAQERIAAAEQHAQERIAAAEKEAQDSISTAETDVRSGLEGGAREVTRAAVRAFGASVVSLGTDVSQAVSAGLREHRGDDVYATLIHIDHSVQQMIRQAQSYVIVCGGLAGRRWPQQSLTDIVGGAIGRVRDFTRVRPQQLDRVVISRAVEPLVHTAATLLDNALRYSPPTSFVDVTFQEGHHGVTVIVDDAGVRMNSEQLEEARQVLAGERAVDVHQLGPTPRTGFPGIAALARRYGFTVYIDGPNAYGGMRAMVYVPETLLVPLSEQETTTAANSPTEIPQEPVQSNSSEEQPPVHDITPGGLPRRRRRNLAATTVSHASAASTDATLPRPEIAAAWHRGSQTGRAAADEHTEGMTS